MRRTCQERDAIHFDLGRGGMESVCKKRLISNMHKYRDERLCRWYDNRRWREISALLAKDCKSIHKPKVQNAK